MVPRETAMAMPKTSGQPAGSGQKLQLEPLPIALLDQPLDFIFAEHFRQRCVIGALRRFVANGSAARAEADQVVAHCERDVVLHHQDEEGDLFPAVRRRALPSDNLGAILATLTEDHRQASAMIEIIVEALAARIADDPVKIKRADREVMMAYARSEQRHLAIENGIVLVIARKRLTEADLVAISRSMKTRRGVVT
jgi:hypothetical protein